LEHVNEQSAAVRKLRKELYFSLAVFQFKNEFVWAKNEALENFPLPFSEKTRRFYSEAPTRHSVFSQAKSHLNKRNGKS
jgi:hypothetical protein